MTQLKVIFAGTPGFAAASLGALLGQPEIAVVAVYTQPDKPAGRAKLLSDNPTPFSSALGLPLLIDKK